MSPFDSYADKCHHLRMERRNCILQITLHSDGQTLRWGSGPHAEFGPAFRDIGADPDNKVIIMTGIGDAFIEAVDSSNVGKRLPTSEMSPRTWNHIYWNAKQLLMNLLEIKVPMIAAVNGPVSIHAELGPTSDSRSGGPKESSIVRARQRCNPAPGRHLTCNALPPDSGWAQSYT